MRFVEEAPKSIPVLAEAEVLVVGSGPSGLAAAIAAAREGFDTLLVERYGCFGGTITQTGVEAFAWYRHEATVEAGGLVREIEDAALRLGASSPESQSLSQALDAEMFKYVADRLVLEAGIRPILHCLAVQAIVEDGLIKGIITESKSGRQAILAKRVIDCTGDGDIAALAGAAFTKGRRDELMQVTPIFHCKGVDTGAFRTYVTEVLKPRYKDWQGESWNQTTSGKEDELFSPYLEKPFIQAVKEGRVSPDANVGLGGTWSTIDDASGEVTQLNMVFMRGYDCTDVIDLTRAEIAGREHCLKALSVLRSEVPGFGKAQIRNFGMTIGTRESRKIEGHYCLTEHDVLNQARFEDSIGIYPEFVDGLSYLYIPTTGRYFQVPYRSILPKGVDNLLVAGRSISGDRAAHCAFRNMSCCVLTGQAAGVAAATSLRRGVTTARVEVAGVQEALRRQGVRTE